MYSGIQGGNIPDIEEVTFCKGAPDGFKYIKTVIPMRNQAERPIRLKNIGTNINVRV